MGRESKELFNESSGIRSAERISASDFFVLLEFTHLNSHGILI